MNQSDLQELFIQIGARIKHLRKEHQISQLELGNIVGLSANQIGRIERAEGNPTIKTLYLIADYYNVEIGYFIDK